MAKKKSKVQANAKKKKFLQSMTQPLNTKSNVQNSLIETGKDLVIGVVGGGLVGAGIGKPSLLIGIAITGVGHYMDNRLIASFGMGMMASNGFQSKSLKGVDGVEDMKERLNTYKKSFMEKTYIDKIKTLKQGKTKATDGFGEVQYFTYPQNLLEGANDDFDILNRIENHISNQGLQLSQVNGITEFETPLEMGELNDYQDAIY
ncbi:MAG: hypothetical protein IPI46_09915 [Bacteroidetes bacterium]|nr:hypothetical protein [Bacteroidota bacterium]